MTDRDIITTLMGKVRVATRAVSIGAKTLPASSIDGLHQRLLDQQRAAEDLEEWVDHLSRMLGEPSDFNRRIAREDIAAATPAKPVLVRPAHRTQEPS